MDIYLTRQGETLGPFSLQAIRKKFEKGDIGPEELVCEVGGVEWKPVRQFLSVRKRRERKVEPGNRSGSESSAAGTITERGQGGLQCESDKAVLKQKVEWFKKPAGWIFLSLALLGVGLWMVGDQWQSVRGMVFSEPGNLTPTGFAILGAALSVYSGVCFCFAVLAWIVERFFANISAIGALLLVAGIVVGILALTQSPGNDETVVRQLVSDLEGGRDEVESMRNVSKALSDLNGKTIDVSQVNAHISDQERKIQHWREDMRDRVGRRESHKMNLLIISGILLVVGAIAVKRITPP